MGNYSKYPFMIKVDLQLWGSYFFINPYRALRKYLQKKGVKNPYQYGETPISVIDKLVEVAGGLEKYQYFADLGAGRGRVCAFIQNKYKCKVFAFERFEPFVKRGRKLFPQIKFISGDFLTKDFSSIDLIYLYGTMMTEKEILLFTSKVSKGTKVITISYPLTDYDSRFQVLEQLDIDLPWGKTKGFIQCLRK
jgi:hypothetical protein